MRLTMGLLPLIFLSSVVTAEKFVYPAQSVPAAGLKELKISGVRGRLILKGQSSKTFKVKVSHSNHKRFEDWSLSVERQGNALMLEVSNASSDRNGKIWCARKTIQSLT